MLIHVPIDVNSRNTVYGTMKMSTRQLGDVTLSAVESYRNGCHINLYDD